MTAQFTKLTARVAALLVNDVDTDQIIPARFLKTTSREGLGTHLFADWRRAGDFVLDRPSSRGAQVLLAGDNFGCGSSREHAPWALYDWGFRAIIATSFADIFRNNSEKNGLLPVVVSPAVHAQLAAVPEVTIDLQTCALSWDGGSVTFPIDPFARRRLLAGQDELGYLLSFAEQVRAYEESHARG